MKHLRKFQILEEVKLTPNVMDILQELKDNGFGCEVKRWWVSKDFTPFNSVTGQYGMKTTPGEKSDSEIKNGHVTYHIRLTSRQGLEFDKFQDMFDAFGSATDRLEEMGKVFRKVNVKTDDSGKIKTSFHIWFVTNEVSTGSSVENFLNLISPILKGLGIERNQKGKFSTRLTNMQNGYLEIVLFTEDQVRTGGNSEAPLRNKHFKAVEKDIKDICRGRYKTSISYNRYTVGRVSIYFKPI